MLLVPRCSWLLACGFFTLLGLGCLPDPTEGQPRPVRVVLQGEGEGEAGEGEGEGEAGEGEGEAGEGEGEGEGEAGEGEGEAGSLVPGRFSQTFSAGGLSYASVVVVPEAAATGPVPLVVALHGNGDSASNFVSSLGLENIARTQGFVLVVPQGNARSVAAFGQDLGVLSWDAYNATNPDILVVDAIIAELQASGSIDPNRIHVMGYSQGGFLAFHLAMKRSTELASVVVASASSPLGPDLINSATRRIPMGLRVGSADFSADALRSEAQLLQDRGHEVVYEEIANAGHVPLPGDVPSLFTFLMNHPR